jgi:hypothetical protein
MFLMTETIQQLKEYISILQEKLQKLEELEKIKTPCEEAFKRVYGYYPVTDIADTCWDGDGWNSFLDGYTAAKEDYKVGEYQEPEKSKINDLAEKLLPDDHPYKIADEHGETNPYKQYLNSVEDEKKMEELGFVKNSDGNWTARPLGETAQERGEKVHKEMEETIKVHDGYEVVDYKPTPQTPEETEKGMREAFVKAQQTEKWKELQRKIDEEDNDKNFKNSLELIKEWGEKNKPPTLTDIIWNWWEDVFTSPSYFGADASIQDLVNRIDKQFIPPYHNTNGYEWEKCLKVMRDKLR